MARAMGLRTQLLGGLAVIIVMVIVSVSLISLWASRQREAGRLVEDRRRLARAAATVLSPLISSDDGRALATALGRLSRLARETGVYHRGRKRWFGGKLALPSGVLRRSLETQEQQVRVDKDSMVLVSPIFDSAGRAVGAFAQRYPGVRESSALPRIYYILMILDGVVLLAFVSIVIRRTVAAPLRRLQDAAAAVARGDLEHRVSIAGPHELASLGCSFNAMTEALAVQLETLEAQRQSLIRSEKLASVGRLAAGVAHEIGNPLQSVIGFTDLLLETPPTADKQRELLGRMQSEAQRIHLIVGQLLDYSRPVGEAAEAVDLAQLCGEARALLTPQKRFKGVEVVLLETLEGLPPARINRQRLLQVLINLMLNAADAMDGQGRVTLGGGRGEDGSLQVSVQNDGPAIPRELRDQIFDPFFTSKEPGEGTGLGLAVSRSIMDSFGGGLQVADLDEGARFELALPEWEG